ncbi:hypothetical protein [Pseudomonas phage vB_Pae_WS1160]
MPLGLPLLNTSTSGTTGYSTRRLDKSRKVWYNNLKVWYNNLKVSGVALPL